MERVDKTYMYRGFEVTHSGLKDLYVFTSIIRPPPIYCTGLWSDNLKEAEKSAKVWIDSIVNSDSELLGLEISKQNKV